LEELFAKEGILQMPPPPEEPIQEELDEGELLEEVPLFLWEQHLQVYQLYRLLFSYFGEGYSIDTAVLLALIAAKSLDLEQTLYDVSYLHAGFKEKVHTRNQHE
jgi:hypothetical protein